MGWSCARDAGYVLDAFTAACIKNSGNQNTWTDPKTGKRYFFETSRTEHYDGAITGTIWRFLPDDKHVRKSGSFRIEGDGEVTRAPAFLKKAAKGAVEKRTAEREASIQEAREKAKAEGKFVLIF
jgi:hypothetical protein